MNGRAGAAARGRPQLKRGRPPKFGRPGRVVAITLPEEAIRGLRRVDADLAWAIVRLLEKQSPRAINARRRSAESHLADVANGQSLIVVNRQVVRRLPGVNLIPLDRERAFLTLDRNAGASDLELAILDRMERRSISARERTALAELRQRLRRLRRDPRLRCHTRSIIVVERVR